MMFLSSKLWEIVLCDNTTKLVPSPKPSKQEKTIFNYLHINEDLLLPIFLPVLESLPEHHKHTWLFTSPYLPPPPNHENVP